MNVLLSRNVTMKVCVFVVFLSASYLFSLTPLCPMLQLTSPHHVKLDRCILEVFLLSAKGCFIGALKHAHRTLIKENDFILDLHLHVDHY